MERMPPDGLTIVPPRVLLNPETMLMVPVELLVSVPPWTVPLFKSNVEAPVKVRLPPLMVALFTEIVPVLALIVPPPLPTVVLVNTSDDPAVASIVPVFVTPPFGLIVIPAD